MKISEQDVRQVAELADLKLSGAEVSRLRAELDGILAHVEKLNEVDTSGVEPMAQVLVAQALAREDKVAQALAYEDKVAQALACEDKVAQALACEDKVAQALACEDKVAQALACEDKVAQALACEDKVAQALACEDKVAQALACEDTLRDDAPLPPLGNQAALANAPQPGAGYFKVPKVIER